jgi:hypothetical protein
VGKKTNKKEPSLINLRDNAQPIKGETCFSACKNFGVSCVVSECRYFQDMAGNFQNCIINASEQGPLTLQEVGDIFDVTRMRICQIEKIAKQILKTSIETVDNPC